MIDGIWWLVILLVIVAALWLIAHLRGSKVDKNGKTINNSHKSPKPPTNDSLQKLSELIRLHFPEYQVSRRANHLLITKQGVKVAMLTIDKSVATGQRRLGEVPVINYHRVPSRAQLSAHLQDS